MIITRANVSLALILDLFAHTNFINDEALFLHVPIKKKHRKKAMGGRAFFLSMAELQFLFGYRGRTRSHQGCGAGHE